MFSVPVLIGSFLSAFILTGVLRHVALRKQILDIPQQRSAHSQPTPTGGGLAIVLPVLVVASVYFGSGALPANVYLAILGGLAIALVGLLDDLVQLKVWMRISLQFSAAVWSVICLGEVAAINVAGWELSNFWVLSVLAVFALVWLLNLYNFMDGIDGIAGSELVFVNAMSLLLVINTEAASVGLLATALLAAAAGFLCWNWPPAKIFMGDVGSGFSGFMLGLLALLSMQAGVMTVWTWLILLGVFVTDATLTLARRVSSRQRWYEGHSCHAYQHATRKYKSHSKVTITIVVINCVWLAPLAYLSTREQELGFFLSLLALTPLALVAYRFQAGISPFSEPVSNQSSAR